ncbi:hypothetical protein [Ligilactobacillus saerimneri]|uniref:hypothetical protein n=1 Tax=Ligilactobacillus saerimneri TaxID=228229 RepID=UPI0024B8C535|nr:hypothetical protein [Ligilactobacillus saerimneri]
MIKRYGRFLLHAALPVVILLALVNLLDTAAYRYVLNYFIMSNYLFFFPFNEEQNWQQEQATVTSHQETLRRAREEYQLKMDSDSEPMTRSRAEAQERSIVLSDLFIQLARNALLVIVAPIVFLYHYLGKN